MVIFKHKINEVRMNAVLEQNELCRKKIETKTKILTSNHNLREMGIGFFAKNERIFYEEELSQSLIITCFSAFNKIHFSCASFHLSQINAQIWWSSM